MPNATQPARIGDLIKYEEAESLYSRDAITLASGNNLALGAVLGIVTASGKYAALIKGARVTLNTIRGKECEPGPFDPL